MRVYFTYDIFVHTKTTFDARQADIEYVVQRMIWIVEDATSIMFDEYVPCFNVC